MAFPFVEEAFDEWIVANNDCVYVILMPNDRQDRSRTPRKEAAAIRLSNRDFRLILQTRRYACVIDCPRNARRGRELRDACERRNRHCRRGEQDEEGRGERGTGARWRGGEDEGAGRREWRAERKEEEEDINSKPV